MKGHEFLRLVRRLGRANEVPVHYDPRPGKGSHGRLYYGSRSTTLISLNKEIGPSLLRKMVSDLGFTKDELLEG